VIPKKNSRKKKKNYPMVIFKNQYLTNTNTGAYGLA
jgi:hypothetical protein